MREREGEENEREERRRLAEGRLLGRGKQSKHEEQQHQQQPPPPGREGREPRFPIQPDSPKRPRVRPLLLPPPPSSPQSRILHSVALRSRIGELLCCSSSNFDSRVFGFRFAVELQISGIEAANRRDLVACYWFECFMIAESKCVLLIFVALLRKLWGSD